MFPQRRVPRPVRSHSPQSPVHRGPRVPPHSTPVPAPSLDRVDPGTKYRVVGVPGSSRPVLGPADPLSLLTGKGDSSLRPRSTGNNMITSTLRDLRGGKIGTCEGPEVYPESTPGVVDRLYDRRGYPRSTVQTRGRNVVYFRVLPGPGRDGGTGFHGFTYVPAP